MRELRRAAVLFSILVSELGLIFWVDSSLWSVVIAVPAVPIIRETGGDHVGSSVVVEVPSGSLPSSVGSSISIVVVVVLRSGSMGFCFLTKRIFSVRPACG